MIYIFWLLSFILVTYLIFKNRYIDLFTIAIVCFFYYSFPAFTGTIVSNNGNYISSVHDGTYVILISIVISLLLGIIVYDYKYQYDYKLQKKIHDIKTPKHIIHLLCYFTIFIFFLNFIFVDISIFLDPDKTLISNEDTRFYNLSLWLSIICLILGAKDKCLLPMIIGGDHSF